ncbi:tyrosine-type recombinase/integrase [Nesterenkonia rhizosphaerae]|uniref:Tyrosine-type recombinase/integrase n=1 Tax=Nesterenkonia rhizosphaerae TaxID=1348272 RepID=A0ABP9G8I3_9MICC
MANTLKLRIGECGDIQKPYKLSNGSFRVRVLFRDLDGKVKPLTAVGKTKGDARARLKEKWEEKSKALGHRGASDGVTLEELLLGWIDHEDKPRPHKKQLSENTRYKYRAAIHNDIIPRAGELRLSEITTGMLNSLLDDLVDADGTGYTRAKRAMTVLISSWKWGIGEGLARGNPTRDLEPIQTPKRDVVILEMHELTILREAIAAWSDPKGARPGPKSNRVANIFELMLATGCRISEILALDYKDVHLNPPAGADPTQWRPWIYIHRSVKENPDGWLWIGPTKTEDTRAIALPAFGVEVLRRVLTEGDGTGLVFQAGKPRTGKAAAAEPIVRPENVRRALRSAMRYAEVPEDIRTRAKPHTLRKTVATHLERHLDLKAAAKQLGHLDDKVTRKHYVAIDGAIIDHAELIEKLSASTLTLQTGSSNEVRAPVFLD